MPPRPRARRLFEVLKARQHDFRPALLAEWFSRADKGRVDRMAKEVGAYISTNLPKAFEKRRTLAHYRVNPYVMVTSASVMDLTDPRAFARFLFNTKLYMALETSFGKSMQGAFLRPYPIGRRSKWSDPPEKRQEFARLAGLSREERAGRRVSSAWREIDCHAVCGRRRYLVSIKSGPNTINDSQVQAMTEAIISHHVMWAERSRALDPQIEGTDIVIGLTYGTDRTTNNKENQILAKLVHNGFQEEDAKGHPGVLVDAATRSIRVYRCIGSDFWAFIGNPADPNAADFVFLEVLLALAKGLSAAVKAAGIEDRIKLRTAALAGALAQLQLPQDSLPRWVRSEFSEDERFWLATAMTAFFDEGV